MPVFTCNDQATADAPALKFAFGAAPGTSTTAARAGNLWKVIAQVPSGNFSTRHRTRA
jgi:hypothetical protein